MYKIQSMDIINFDTKPLDELCAKLVESHISTNFYESHLSSIIKNLFNVENSIVCKFFTESINYSRSPTLNCRCFKYSNLKNHIFEKNYNLM